MADDDVDGRVLVADAVFTPRPQREIAHFSFDAPGDDPIAAAADGDGADFVKNVSSDHRARRGGRPPHEEACGGRREACG